ncbi:hypothetical protein RM549_10890 [Salegentibacter sp. F188]|uniref:Uncharacterized protein n=1 Tax=Autumnicola patrickiae TaxID=3075591 RepID=A0ABU3E2R7_9FLAO|nr:hypothetical protein [Salegentibacter sp. F188]MDT0690293.1 hypothetical protein [Salegentibacter sp. F188]
MKKLLFLLLVFCGSFCLSAQTFSRNTDTLTKSTKNVFYKFLIKKGSITPQNSQNFVVKIRPNVSNTMNDNEYKIHHSNFTLLELNQKEQIDFFLEINGDSLVDRTRHLNLNLILHDTLNDVEVTTDSLKIVVNPIAIYHNEYRYLAYIGTNFDLVDGVKANNLFFAANIYLEPENNKMGWFVSLYGNRSFTSTDSVTVLARDKRIERLNDSTVLAYRETAELIRSNVSDNLGAHTSFLFPISTINSSTKLFFAPSAEFIWRRTETKSDFNSGIPLDTIQREGRLQIPFVENENSSTTYTSEFSFSIGPGVILAHQTKQMSVRLHSSAGYISSYLPQNRTIASVLEENYNNKNDIYFNGRIWITEATSGITLQAEVTNTLINPRPFYTVTLSKAINFKSLGSIFSPITSR